MGLLAFGEFEADAERFELRRAGVLIEISAKCFDVLVYLIRHRERVVPKAELAEKVWQAQALSASAVPTAVLALRKTLGDDEDSARHVANVRGRGYRFVADVREVAPPSLMASRGSDAAGAVRSRGSNFVGRDSEMAALSAAFERAGGGLPQMVLLAGEAGIGKTRTTEEFAARARVSEATVLVGRCREGEGAPAFWPWVQIVRSLLDQSELAVRENVLRRFAPVLAQMVPDVASYFPGLEPPPPLDPEPARFRLFDTVTQLLQRAGSERALVIVFDDLHRADPASLQLLAFVSRELREAKVLFLVTYRDVEAQRDPPRLSVIAELARQEPSRAIQLHGFSAEEVGEFLTVSSRHASGGGELAQSLHEQSGGNPFFLTQLVHLLEAEGTGARPEKLTKLSTDLPTGVREAVSRQLDGLPAATCDALRVAAAVGREFSAMPVAEVLGMSVSDLMAMLTPARDSRLIVPVPEKLGHHRFSHVMVRDSVYESIESSKRLRLHAEIAAVLERFYTDDISPHAAELAYHYLEAIHECGPEPGVRYSVEAGEWASERLAYEDAARHFGRALSVLEESGPGNLERRCELLLALGEAEMHAGERDRGKRALHAAAFYAKRAGNAALLAQAALRLAPGLFAVEIGVRDRALESLLEDSLAALGHDASPMRARVLARLAMALAWTDEDERRADLVRDAVSVAEVTGDPGARAHALMAKHGLLWAPQCLQERCQLIDEVGPLASHTDDTDLILMHMLFRITALFVQGRIDAADQVIDEYSSAARSLNRPGSLWYAPLFRAARALMRGRFLEAERGAHEFLAIGQRVQDVNAVHSFGAHIFILRLAEGRASENLDMADSYVLRFPAIPAWRCSRAYVYLHAGRHKEARAHYDRFIEQRDSALPANELWSISACMLAEMCVAFRDDRNAEWIYQRLLPGADQYCVIGMSVAVYGCIAQRLGLLAAQLACWDEAEQHFERGIELGERCNSAPLIAQVLYDRAVMMRVRNRAADQELVRSLVSRALQLATQLGMPGLAQKLREIA